MKYTSKPLVILFSILTGLDVLTAAGGLTDVISEKAALVIVLGTKAVTAGATYFSSNWVTPNDKVLAVQTPSGEGAVAGQAATQPTGSAVDVTEAAEPLGS